MKKHKLVSLRPNQELKQREQFVFRGEMFPALYVRRPMSCSIVTINVRYNSYLLISVIKRDNSIEIVITEDFQKIFGSACASKE